MSHYSQVQSYKQSKRREQSQAREAFERQRQAQRVAHMSHLVEAQLRREQALRRLGSI